MLVPASKKCRQMIRSQGKSEVAITSALRQEGYTPAQIAKILQEMNQ